MTKKKPEQTIHWHTLNFRKLISTTATIIRRNWKTFGAITLIYALLFFTFSKGLSSIDVSNLKKEVSDNFGIEPTSIGGQFLLATLLLESSSTQDDLGTTFMLFVYVFISLAYIWVLRHAWLKKTTKLSDAFYKSMYPIIKFILLIGVGLLQFIPMALGAYILGVALKNDILISVPEVVGGYIILLVLPLMWTFNLLIKTIFALFITTIPDMRPLEAYGASKDLVRGKKFYIAKHFIVGIVLYLLLVLGVLLPVILFIPVLAPIVGILASIMALPIFICVSYVLYRSLIGE